VNTGLLVVASYDGSIQALDAHDGSTRWAHRGGHPFFGRALARLADSIIAEAAEGYVVALAIEDGRVHWETTLPDTNEISSPDALSVASSSAQVVVQHYHQCFCLDASDGHIVWRGGTSMLFTLYWWVLAVGKEQVYVLAQERPHSAARLHDDVPSGQSDDPGAIQQRIFVTTALSTWDGTPQWGTRDQSAVEPPWDSSPSLVEQDGVVYTYGYGLHALEAATGRLLWSREEVPRAYVGALAIWRDQVVVVAGGHLGAYRRDTGMPVWSETIPPRTDGYYEGFDGVAASGDLVYVGRSSPTPVGYRVEARTGTTGAVQWMWPKETDLLHSDMSWRFRVAGDTLYIPSFEDLWAVDSSDGTQRWHLAIDPAQPVAFLAIDPAES
jgi:outer membrane protein assembly factor BamB